MGLETGEKIIIIDDPDRSGYRGVVICTFIDDGESYFIASFEGGEQREFHESKAAKPEYIIEHQRKIWGELTSKAKEARLQKQLEEGGFRLNLHSPVHSPKDTIYCPNTGNGCNVLTHYSSAEEEIKKILAPPAGDFEAFVKRANLRYRIGNLTGALEDYTQGISLMPKNAQAYNDRSNTKEMLADYAGSIADIDRAIELDANFVGAYYNRGNAESRYGSYQPAIENFNMAIERDNKFKEAYNNRGIARDKLGEYAKASEDYERVIKLDPQSAIGYYNLGNLKYRYGYNKEALSEMSEAIKRDSDLAAAYYYRGIIEEKMEKFPDAAKDYDIAYELGVPKAAERISELRGKL